MKPELTLKSNFALVLLPILLIPAIFYENMFSMAKVWWVNETFTHGFLILPISIWMIWKKIEILESKSPSPELRVFALFIPLSLLWLIASVIDVQIVQQFILVAFIITTIWIIAGREILFLLSFPLLFLFFMVPFGQEFIPIMMDFTAYFTVSLIKLTGIPIYQDGLYFTLPSGNWSVVEECSGVRYLIASLALGTIYSYISYSSAHKRLIFICFSILVPILANGIRAFLIVMIGHHSGMELAVGADHLLYGWVFFGFVIFLMFYIGSYWWDPVSETEISSDKVLSPIQKSNNFHKIVKPSFFSIIVLLGVSGTTHFMNEDENSRALSNKIVLPINFSEWQLDESRSLNWKPIYNNPYDQVSQVYRFGDDNIQLDIGYFATQSENSEAISSLNRITDPYDGEWKIIFSSELQFSDHYINESEINRIGEKVLVWSWFRVGQLYTPNPYIAKMYQAYNKIINRREDAAIIMISIKFDDEKPALRLKLNDFWSKAKDTIDLKLEKFLLAN